MKTPNYSNKISAQALFLCLVVFGFLFNTKTTAQTHDVASIIGVYSGIDTNDVLFKAASPTIPLLAYIRAQVIEGPQKGIFTQSGNDIRYTSISDVKGIPDNLSRIRFTFLQSDKKTQIPSGNFRFVINDIDGPNNESLAVNCNDNVRFIGTANPTNLVVDNIPPDLNAVGTVDESNGPTSRVMFEFVNISLVEFDNYANDGYLKDFDMDDDYTISTPVFVECIKEKMRDSIDAIINTIGNKISIKTNPIYFERDKYSIEKKATIELEKIVQIMKNYPRLRIEVQSHTDSRNPEDYNLKLSKQRAQASIDWIIARGIDSSRITGEGFGETKLVNKCSNGVKCTEAEHQLNRRTEFVIINPEAIKEKN